MEEKIKIRGARVHNLKNIDLELPKNKIIVFTGVSGSGKSSLAFDTIFAEGQRRYIESLSPYARQFLGQMDRPDVDEITGLSPAIAIDQRALSHNPRSIVGTLTEIYDYLRVLFARAGEVYCPQCGGKIKKLSLEEMVDIVAERANDLGEKVATILSPAVIGRKGEYYQLFYDFLSLGFGEVRIDGEFKSLHDKIILSRYKAHNIDLVVDRVMIGDEGRLFEAIESALNHSDGLVTIIFGEGSKKIHPNLPLEREGSELMLSSKWNCPRDNFSFPEVEPRLFSFNSPHGACSTCHGLGKTDLFADEICIDCGGKRLKPEALAVRVGGKNIYEVTALTIDLAYEFFTNYEKGLSERQKKVVENLVGEIKNRLSFLLEVGLDYLSLNREAETLSGGEAQRIRLASQIGSKLSNTLYVLDEPTIGLHERDIDRLLKTLQSLKEQSNTVVLVEHDEKTILQSDYFVELGPWAGKNGGQVVISDQTQKLLKDTSDHGSLTLGYLKGKKKISIPDRRKRINETLKIVGARANNLKNIEVEIPLRKLVCLTGVSGSGKSSLLYDVLYKNLSLIKARMNEALENVSRIMGSEYFDRVVMVNQSPIGRTPRSNPATYTGIFTPIRDFFAATEDARARGYSASRFSFNVAGGPARNDGAIQRLPAGRQVSGGPARNDGAHSVSGGRCESCEGAGFNLIEMHFLPPVLVQCEVCRGKRFNRETLAVEYKEKNISEVLQLTIDEAYDFFDGIYQITDKLKVLKEVGLGYLQLGQSATTLSGGEAQRIKLARELTHPLGKRAFYILDEPTVGLHFYDVEMLLGVLNKLVDKGNTVVVIEHNMQVIKSADYVIDLGPEGGAGGGRLVAKGTPEEVVENEKSYTGKYLKNYLK